MAAMTGTTKARVETTPATPRAEAASAGTPPGAAPAAMTPGAAPAAMTPGAADAATRTLPILRVPAGPLRQRARRVVETDRAALATLVPAMLRTMYDAPGIGLAAPQIDVGLRLVVIDLTDDEAPERAPTVLVNPEITARSDERAIREEGCLSIPGIYADVARPARVTVRYQDEHLAPRTMEAEGLLAACVQHEIDHLDGILFVDHLSALKRNMLLRRFAKEQRAGGGETPRTGRAKATA